MHWFRGFWGTTVFHTVKANSVEDAFTQLIEWGQAHWWCIDDPSTVVVLQLA